MKKRIEIQLIILLLCGLVFAAAWIGIQVARDNVGVWSEPGEVHFTTNNLSGLAPRSELRCSGIVVGHVRKIESTMQSGAPVFTLKAGVRKDFATWKFSQTASIETPVVATVLSPSSIQLKADNSAESISAVNPAHGTPPVLCLDPPEADSMAAIKDIARKLGENVQEAIQPFIAKEKGGKSKVENLADAITDITKAASDIKEITASVNGQSRQTGTDPASRPPIEQILANIKGATGSLADAATTIRGTLAEGGDVNQLIKTLDAKLDAMGALIKTTEKAVGDLQGQVARMGIDKTLRKMDGLIDESTATVATLHKKAEGLGTTFMSRMFIGKQEKAPASPPAKPQSKTPRSSR